MKSVRILVSTISCGLLSGVALLCSPVPPAFAFSGRIRLLIVIASAVAFAASLSLGPRLARCPAAR